MQPTENVGGMRWNRLLFSSSCCHCDVQSEFVAERLSVSNRTERTFDRALHDVPNDMYIYWIKWILSHFIRLKRGPPVLPVTTWSPSRDFFLPCELATCHSSPMSSLIWLSLFTRPFLTKNVLLVSPVMGIVNRTQQATIIRTMTSPAPRMRHTICPFVQSFKWPSLTPVLIKCRLKLK